MLNDDKVQTRAEHGELAYHDTVREAFRYAAEHPDVWKISWDEGEYRIRLVRQGEGWVYEPLLPETLEEAVSTAVREIELPHQEMIDAEIDATIRFMQGDDLYPEEKTIKRNAVRCDSCGDVIESKFRHDFVTCSCGKVSVDGGRDYLKRSFSQGAAFTDLSE